MIGMRTAVLASVAAAVALALAGCGERPQVINYKQGKYQGKPDTPAFNSRAVQRQQAAVGERDRYAHAGPERIRAPARLTR